MRPLTVVFATVAVLPLLLTSGRIIPENEISTYAASPVVELPDGRVIGTVEETVDTKTPYEAFRGIPYAQPPVGALRFASPVKNAKWNGILDATKDANVCIQGSGEDIRGSEDCLYINVYSPKNANNLPVMVWIYGGAFRGGDSTYESYGPDYFLDNQEVVFVSFNYRLGIFGFMGTEDQVVSGNWGLKDQVLALKWIQENIGYFGGDAGKVTIFGESAGGASVSYLLQIPKAQGLFHRAIIQSGNSENLWALSTRARHAAFNLGVRLGIPAVLSRTLVARLREVDAYRLQETAQSVWTQVFILNPFRGLTWGPVIEVEGPDAVFTEASDDYLKSGRYPNKVPVLIGYTSNEAGHAHAIPDNVHRYLAVYEASDTNLAPFSITSRRAAAAAAIQDYFFAGERMSRQFDEVVRFINIDQFARGTIRTAENMAQYVPVYFYVFGYEGKIVGEKSYTGAGHAEELFYLFRTPTTNDYSPEDLEVRAKLIKIWTNFAIYANPTPSRDRALDNIIWPAVNPASSNLDYVWLNYTLSLDTNPSGEDYAFYKNIFNTYGQEPFTTY